MIEKSTLQFLKDLSKNNNREWFADNKSRYLAAKENAEHFATQMVSGIREFDKTIGHLEPKDCMFRIYRDARFSLDKTPYKTNMGIVVQRGGKKTQYSCYYVHIEPGSCFFSGGIYMPSPEVLKTLRDLIDVDFEEFQEIIKARSFKKYFSEIEGDSLVKVPQGFSKDSPAAEYVKMKNFYTSCAFDEKTVLSKDFLKLVLQISKSQMPLNHFFNAAIEDMEG
ncbi:MAG: DUF2461 domain-containing protein [Prevotellaceae bacterium]|jgi:uncharacterized protein (TIGR02453 family)|nr:DUF2461 domain-containing protein [Prevotellaceae bacterium]